MSRTYLDTSVLLPILIQEHENHLTCKQLLQQSLRNGVVISSATHAYAELYRNLTRNRPPYALSPENVQKAVVDQLVPLLGMISLDQQDYEAAIQRCVDLELKSSIIYDALHVQAALKAKAQVLYTDNLRDFSRLITEDDALELKGIRA